jgi:hypothetical protein
MGKRKTGKQIAASRRNIAKARAAKGRGGAKSRAGKAAFKQAYQEARFFGADKKSAMRTGLVAMSVRAPRMAGKKATAFAKIFSTKIHGRNNKAAHKNFSAGFKRAIKQSASNSLMKQKYGPKKRRKK